MNLLNPAAEGESETEDIREQIEYQHQECLKHAINCAILAPAGPSRSRILAKLYKDERCQRSVYFC